MLIEVLFVPGCPNHGPVVERLKEVLRAEAVNTPIHEIAVADELTARSLKFPGSPTVRIDGRDVEPNAEHRYGLACRLYSDGSGSPSAEALRSAVAGAQGEGSCDTKKRRV